MYNCNLRIFRRDHGSKYVPSSEFYIENDNVMADLVEDFIRKF